MSDSKYPADLPVSQQLILEHLADIAAALRENTEAIKASVTNVNVVAEPISDAVRKAITEASRRERR